MASVVHNEPYISVREAFTAILMWIDAKYFQIYRPARKVYLKPTINGSRTDSEFITEIQFPNEKS